MNRAGIAKPVFSFEGVSVRVFPLRADETALQRLCDTYLNLCPEEIYFRPAAPYVLFAVLDYARMSCSFEDESRQGGASQKEAYFGVPLAWGRLDRGLFKALGSAMMTPFIFLDHPPSIEFGRTIYGFPKEPAEFWSEAHPWPGGRPADREHVLTLAAETFPAPFAGQRPGHVPLVDIDRCKRQSLGQGMWRSLLGVGGPGWGALTLWREVMRTWSSAVTPDAASYLRTILGNTPLWPNWQLPTFSTANLKQVRSLEAPAIASYQAITMAPMRVVTLHRAGPLGGTRIAVGDPTGGYRIHVHRHPLFPIVESLGLVVSPQERPYGRFSPGGDEHQRERRVTSLEPLFPFFIEADLEFGGGAAALWRSPHPRGGAWQWRAATSTHADGAAVHSAAAPSGIENHLPSAPRFDPTWGARYVPAPPYYYPQLALRVLALPATQDLAKIVAEWQPPPGVGGFELLGSDRPHILMMVATAEKMTAQINDIGAWWRHRVSFFVPVLWTRDEKEQVALVSVSSFADSRLAATIAGETEPEVISADIHASPDSWFDCALPGADRRLLRMATSVLLTRDMDVQDQPQVLLEVLARDHREADVSPVSFAAPVDEDIRLCLVGRRRIRDTVDPAMMAYEEWFSQNLIARNHSESGWQRSTAAPQVRIHKHPGRLDLVSRFALDAKVAQPGQSLGSHQGSHGTVVSIMPTGFAWAVLELTHESNTSLAVRSHQGPWTAPSRPPGFTGCEPQANEAFGRLLAAFDIRPERYRHG